MLLSGVSWFLKGWSDKELFVQFVLKFEWECLYNWIRLINYCHHTQFCTEKLLKSVFDQDWVGKGRTKMFSFIIYDGAIASQWGNTAHEL